jgi:hypothetical protein
VTAKTPAERKAAERERNRAGGLVQRHVWIDIRDYPRLLKYVERLNRARGK